VIIHGGCPTGADAHAAQWAFDFDVREEVYPANWEMYGKAAGLFRNQQMVDAGADVCLAFPLGESRGTRDCVRRAVEAGIPVKVIEWNDGTGPEETRGQSYIMADGAEQLSGPDSEKP